MNINNKNTQEKKVQKFKVPPKIYDFNYFKI